MLNYDHTGRVQKLQKKDTERLHPEPLRSRYDTSKMSPQDANSRPVVEWQYYFISKINNIRKFFINKILWLGIFDSYLRTNLSQNYHSSLLSRETVALKISFRKPPFKDILLILKDRCQSSLIFTIENIWTYNCLLQCPGLPEISYQLQQIYFCRCFNSRNCTDNEREGEIAKGMAI